MRGRKGQRGTDHCCGFLKPHAVWGQVLAAGSEVGLGAKEGAGTPGGEGVKFWMATGGQTAPCPAAGPATVLPAGMRKSTSRQVLQKHIWVVGTQAGYVELLTFVSAMIVTSLSELKPAITCMQHCLHQGYRLSLHNPQLLYWPTLYIPLMIHTRHSTDSRIGCTAYLRYCWGVANLCHGGNCIHSQTWKKLTNEMWCCVSWISLTCSMNTTEASVCMPCRSSNVFYKSLPSPENGTGVSSGLLPGMIHIDPLTFILWCHFLQCPSEIGSASAERMGQGEVGQGDVGGCTWRV